MSNDRYIDLIKKVFELEELVAESFLEGLLSGRTVRYIIPEENFNKVAKDFPFIKNALNAGLFKKIGKNSYFTTQRILDVRATHKRRGKNQFFSLNGDDANERTTLHDMLATLSNLKYIAKRFGVETDKIKFSIRHENGNPEKIVNYVELDKSLFGNSEFEVEENVNKLNKHITYDRLTHNREYADAV
jgi:hypothetical protein